MDQLPRERQGVRPGFGLEDASLQSSDLPDQLRNTERKEGAIPMGPKRFFSPEQSAALNSSFGVPRHLQSVGRTAESAGASPEQIDQFLRNASREELKGVFGEFKAAKLLKKRNDIFKREFGR
jgi:hypothetical protein